MIANSWGHKQGMSPSDNEDLLSQLTEENRLLKENLETFKKKYEMCEAEVKTLLRKLVKLLEEKVERLEQDLTILQS